MSQIIDVRFKLGFRLSVDNVIVLPSKTCYAGSMERQADQKQPRSQALRLHRALVAFLTTVYLFVGVVHASAHVNEVIAQVNQSLPATISLETSVPATDGFGDVDSEKSSGVAEYCQVYAPSMMPVPAVVGARPARPIDLLFVTPTRLVEEIAWLDTPPPRRLTLSTVVARR